MDSITELGKLEAQIFKKGSGSGTNLSTLRSSKEAVKGGGTACLTGDTELIVDYYLRKFGKNKSKRTILELFNQSQKSRNNILPRVRCIVDNGELGSNKIKNIFYNGNRPVYLVTTKKNYKIKATDNHCFLSETGYIELNNFHIGDKIAVTGSQKQIGKDENVYNNNLENLEILCNSCHQKEHAKRRSNGIWELTKEAQFDTIVNIEFVGNEDVFDIQMEAPYHNFIANGFVSHNSGPTSFLKAHDILAGVVKCITPDSYIFTEFGLNKIENTINTNTPEGFHETDTISIVDGNYDLIKPSKLYSSGKEENIKKIKLDYTRLELKGTEEHPLLTLTKEFQLEYKKLKDITVGDYIAVGRGFNIWSNVVPEFNFIPNLQYTTIPIIYPTRMTKKLARILGYLVSEGHLDHRLGFSNADSDVLEDFVECFESVFGINISDRFTEKVNQKTNVTTFEVRLEWKGLIQFLDFIGFNSKISKTKVIPSCVLCSPKKYIVEFLKAYFEGDGSISRTQIYSTSASSELSKQIQLLLLNFGIVSSFKTTNIKDVDYYLVDIHGKEIDIFMKEIGFITDYKNNRYCDIIRNTNIDVVPYLNTVIRSKGKSGYYKCTDGKTRKIKFETLTTRKNSSYDKIIETESLKKLEIIDENLYHTLNYILDKQFFWDKAISNEPFGKSKVFDFTIPISHSFIANGIISHNSGGTLRRSAKLACLNIDHPDIEEFINCKIFEEEKLAILRKAGVKNRPGYDLADEVYFQNTNISVRITDEFMKKVISDKDWSTVYVNDKGINKTYQARDLLRKIAEASWQSGDPGLQFHDIVNKWNTLANTKTIEASNPCGEFLSINDTSCNLASINLIKFFLKDENNNFTFDFKTFEDVIKTVIIAQDILIDKSSYPSEKIESNSKIYRSLGLGYTNLGGLLMWLGVPYDSSEGRLIAAGLTALMTGIAYKTSGDLADKVGPFTKFEDNKNSFMNVLNQHSTMVHKLVTNNTSKKEYLQYIIYMCSRVWDEVFKRKNFRNSQTTLLAPTGTISSLMNSVTTGIEPEYSLIRYKRLAGSDGATLKFVNPIVEESLRNLGYSEEELPELVKELINLEDKDIKTRFKEWEHREVFLTAAPAPGSNKNLCINYMGHVKMCAAVQPFLSGGISKTINMPKDCTIDEVYDLYIEAWKMGLKGITIYRDESKNFQPLSHQDNCKEITSSVELIRKRLPDERMAITHKFRVGNTEGYLTCGLYPHSNTLGEIFVNISKEGSTISGFADAIATIVSISLQYGVPLKNLVSKLSYLKFEPHGFSSNPDIRSAYSIIDYIFRYLGLKFLSYEDRKELGLLNSKELENFKQNNTPNSELIIKQDDTSPICPTCGNIMRRLGSCFFCNNCSYNTGSCG